MQGIIESNENGKAPLADEKGKGKSGKSKRYLPSLPSAPSADEMSKVEFTGLVDKTPIEWKSLENYELFSLSADGHFPMIKVSRSKAVRLVDRKVFSVGSGRCHRITLGSH